MANELLATDLISCHNFLFFTAWYWTEMRIASVRKHCHWNSMCAPGTYLEFIYVPRSSLENVVTDMFHEHSAWLDSSVIMRPCLREEWRCARLQRFAFHLETVTRRYNCFVLIHRRRMIDEDKYESISLKISRFVSRQRISVCKKVHCFNLLLKNILSLLYNVCFTIYHLQIYYSRITWNVMHQIYS